MKYEIDVKMIRAIMGYYDWKLVDLAEIWQVNRNTAATYLIEPEKIPYHQMLQLAQAANLSQEQMANIFFKPAKR